MAKKSKEGAAAHAIRTVEVPDCPAVRVKVMGGGTLPAGGTTGQVLTKKSDSDGDVAWKDAGGGGIVVKRYEKMFDTPLEIRPIDANNPVAVQIPLAELGLGANYDVVGVQRVATGTSPAGLKNPGFVILVDCWVANGNLVLSLVSARTSVRTMYRLSFTAYFIKK